MKTTRAILVSVSLACLTPAALLAGELSPPAKRALRYLEAVRDGIRNYHIDGEAHPPETYAKAAWESMIRVLEVGAVKGVDKERVPVLIEALRRASMDDLPGLVDLLDRFAARAGGVDVEQLADVGARGMFLPLQDPFSSVMDEKTMGKLLQAMLSPEDKSLGLSPTRAVDGSWTVAHVRGCFPAEDEGVRIGDRLLAIDGEPVERIPPTQILERLQVEEGTTVRVTIQRSGWPAPRALALRQGPVKRQNVRWAMFPGKIGYIRTMIFNLTMGQEVEKALQALESQGMRGLVLDLRGNPGGALPVCVSVAEKFLAKDKEIATIDNRHPMMKGRQICRASGKSARPDLPLVVLIDKASASASEMLSGTLKANGRATVVGETSFGKGVGQSVIPLGARLSHQKGMMMLYITLMQYYLPGQIAVQHKGVEPSVVASPDEDPPEVAERVEAFRESGVLSRWAAWVAAERPDDLEAALGFTEEGLAGFPELIGLLQDLDTPVPPEILAREAYRAARRALEDAGRKPAVVRPREDAVLCRGVFELLLALNLEEPEAPGYGFVFRRFGR